MPSRASSAANRTSLSGQPTLPRHYLQPRPFALDRRLAPVPRHDPEAGVQRGEPRERVHHGCGVTAREVDPPPAAGEERVAREEHAVLGGYQGDRSLRMPGRVKHLETHVAETDQTALGELHGRNAWRDGERREEL